MRRSEPTARRSHRRPRHRAGRSAGFTLLEVMVALTITGMALGALFGVIAGNKRLAWTAEDVLLRSLQARSLLNLVQLNDAQGEVFLERDSADLQLQTDQPLEVPLRETIAIAAALRGFEITDASGAVLYRGSYWIRQAQPGQSASGDAFAPPATAPPTPSARDPFAPPATPPPTPDLRGGRR